MSGAFTGKTIVTASLTVEPAQPRTPESHEPVLTEADTSPSVPPSPSKEGDPPDEEGDDPDLDRGGEG
jgi:hypothetical protein